MAVDVKFACILCAFCITSVLADTPANCTYEDIRGTWIVTEGPRNSDKTENCTNFEPGQDSISYQVQLAFPDVAVDEHGNEGFWTLVYNQGFEIRINYRSYFAFSKFIQNGTKVVSYCDETLPASSHDVIDNNWSCFTARKVDTSPPKVSNIHKATRNHTFGNNQALIAKINRGQRSWTAKHYPQFESMMETEILQLKGGIKSKISAHPTPAPVDDETKKLVRQLPLSFDWRNVGGINYVSPVRNQGSCGSCYSFGSMAMIEARVRVATNNSVKPVFSTQDIVSCSPYSQGCEGGFPYLVAGRYGHDYGFIEESCFPYTGSEEKCKVTQCSRTYVADYRYVGNFYGGCNEELMRIKLVQNGPISVSFEVYDDFLHYSGGIYHHTGFELGFNPFGITNHVVLVVGYGADSATGEPFWIVKNSWGPSWGEDGFFRIVRGTNECNIETLAVEAFPIP